MKKALSLAFAFLFVFTCLTPCFAADVSKIEDYKALFVAGEGPEVDGLSVDYVSYSPETEEGVKYPLVVYFHGMNQGSKPGAQIEENNFPLWASEELQSRFTNGGAFLFVPRSHEENKEYWDDKYIVSVKAAIDDFIEANKEYVDVTRIYVGGFSMGGKMTLKMATSYPEYFAAAFPMCPAYYPSEEQYKAIANMPVWLITSKYDVVAGYHVTGEDVWEGICNNTTVPESCRLTLFGKVCYPDGEKTPSNHYVWYAVSNDLFTYDNDKYYNAETTDANGETIILNSPNGVISWLCSFTSEYDGETTTFTDLAKDNEDDIKDLGLGIVGSIPLVFADTVVAAFKSLLVALNKIKIYLPSFNA